MISIREEHTYLRSRFDIKRCFFSHVNGSLFVLQPNPAVLVQPFLQALCKLDLNNFRIFYISHFQEVWPTFLDGLSHNELYRTVTVTTACNSHTHAHIPHHTKVHTCSYRVAIIKTRKNRIMYVNVIYDRKKSSVINFQVDQTQLLKI